MLLTLLGHEARSATTGEAALHEAASFEPDVAILDIGLPDLSGFDLARELRTRCKGTLYLAAMTGWGQPQDRVRALAAGFDLHVLKPADRTKIAEILALADRAISRDPDRA